MGEKIKLEDFEKFRIHLLENERSKNTIDAYYDNFKAFTKKYDEISKETMLDFKKWQLSLWKPKTVSLRRTCMNQYCKFIGHPEYMVKRIKIQRMTCVENVITVNEYKKLLDGLKADGNEKGYWMVQYLAKTGARASEFVRLTKTALDTGYCEMWTKGKIRRIYIPKDLIEESRAYFDGVKGEYLFRPKEECDRPYYSARGVAENLRRWAKRYGIRSEVMHPHSFRHLFAIEFLKKNSNIALLADLMGHSDVGTTAIYLRLSKEEQMKQFNEAMDW